MAILGQFNNPFLPDDPDKREAAREGLLQFGASLLGGRGNLGGVLGQGLLAGSQGYQQSLQRRQQSGLDKAQQERWEMENQMNRAKLNEPMELARILAGDQPPTGGGQSPMPTPQVGAISGLPIVGSAPPAMGMPTAPQPQRQTSNVANMFETYRGYGDRLTMAGKPAAAKQYYDLAEKLRPKLKEQSTLSRDGKRVTVNVYDDGRTEELDGFAPAPEKLNFQDIGGSTLALDPFTAKPVETIRNTLSPAEQAANSRHAERLAFDRSLPRGTVVQTDNGPLLVDPRTGSSQDILDPQGKPLPRMTKPLNDAQSKALLFGTRMQESDKQLSELARSGTTTSNPLSRAPMLGGVVSALSSDNQQSLDQAKRDFVNAVLRRESGAAIADSEFANADKQYFPQIGDGPKVIAQKARNRKLAIDGVLAEVPEKQRASITPKAAPSGPFNDAEKERRYQEWKAKQGK